MSSVLNVKLCKSREGSGGTWHRGWLVLWFCLLVLFLCCRCHPLCAHACRRKCKHVCRVGWAGAAHQWCVKAQEHQAFLRRSSKAHFLCVPPPDCSSMTLLVGFPAPWPALTSMRVSSGLRWGELGAPGLKGSREEFPLWQGPLCEPVHLPTYMAPCDWCHLRVSQQCHPTTCTASGPGSPASTCCSVAVSLWECSGTTRSSWSPVVIRKALGGGQGRWW